MSLTGLWLASSPGSDVAQPDTRVIEAFPLITTMRVGDSRPPSLPFPGLAEAYVLAAFRAAGVVRDYLRTVSYQQGHVEQIRLPPYEMIDVIVDPRINSPNTDCRESWHPGC